MKQKYLLCVKHTKTSRKENSELYFFLIYSKTKPKQKKNQQQKTQLYSISKQTVLTISFWSQEDLYSIFLIHSLIMVLLLSPLCSNHVIICSGNILEKDHSCKGDMVYGKLRSVMDLRITEILKMNTHYSQETVPPMASSSFSKP